MRKIVLYAWVYLWVTLSNVTGHSISDLNLDEDNDGLTSIECSIRPLARQSSTPTKRGPHKAANDSTSFNWSGYVAFTGNGDNPNPTYGSVKSVSGSWIVPAVAPNPNGDTFSATWVGIDGYISPTVEQIGTEQDVISGVQSNYAWFELYPADQQVIDGFPVNAGDVIEGKVYYLGESDGNDVFRLTLKNWTQRKKFSVVQQTITGIPAHRSSAEWIVEAPSETLSSGQLAIFPLAQFSEICFNNCKVEIDGHKGSISNRHWTFLALTMISNATGVVKATPSELDCKGNSFCVTWQSPGPFPYEILP